PSSSASSTRTYYGRARAHPSPPGRPPARRRRRHARRRHARLQRDPRRGLVPGAVPDGDDRDAGGPRHGAAERRRAGAVIVEAIAGGVLTGALADRRRQRTIEHLSDHYIICGYGRVGRRVAEEF